MRENRSKSSMTNTSSERSSTSPELGSLTQSARPGARVSFYCPVTKSDSDGDSAHRTQAQLPPALAVPVLRASAMCKQAILELIGVLGKSPISELQPREMDLGPRPFTGLFVCI